MNNDLTQEADPQEVIKELKTAYQQVYEESKRLRADIMFLENGKAEFKAERDAYRRVVQNFVDKVERGEARSKRSYAEMKAVLDQYTLPSPKDKDNG